MIYTEKTKAALKICYEAHKDQVDKSGVPYVFHPFHLAEQMLDEETTVVALLHDVVEDTNVTLKELEIAGFSRNCLEAISLMTHQKGVGYFEYIEGLKDNQIARKVKLADLKHNSDITRIDAPTQKDLERVKKYNKAFQILWEAEVNN